MLGFEPLISNHESMMITVGVVVTHFPLYFFPNKIKSLTDLALLLLNIDESSVYPSSRTIEKYENAFNTVFLFAIVSLLLH